MMRLICAAALALLVLWCPAFASDAEDPWEKWSYRAPILFDDPGDAELFHVTLPDKVVDQSRSDLRDLRIVSEKDRTEVGYVVRREYGETRHEPLGARLYNRTFVPYRSASITVDFGKQVMKNRVEVTTSGINFRRRLQVEGSDDGRSWQVVRTGGYVIDARWERGGSFQKRDISIPDNNQRYLRITVLHDLDDPKKIHISDVEATRTIRRPPAVLPVPVGNLEVIQVKKTTEIRMDLGHRHLPLHRAVLSFPEPNFFRRWSLLGRNSVQTTMREAMEDGGSREKQVETPWKELGSGMIWRFSGSKDVDESLVVDLARAPFRYIMIRIENKDDSPLNVDQVQVEQFVQSMLFARPAEGPYALYFGHSKAKQPQYDLAHFVDRLKEQGTATARLGDVQVLAELSEKQPPWSERHKGLLWGALLAGLAILVILVLRQVKNAAPPDKPDGMAG